MNIVNFINNRIPKHNPSSALLSPANRSFLLFLTFIAFVVISWVVYATLQPSADEVVEKINANGTKLSKSKVTSKSKVSEEYAQDIKTVNKAAYEQSKQKLEGSTLPTLYNTQSSNEDVIKSCECSFDKEALIKEILARGDLRISNTDAMRVGVSDIYIRPSSLIVDDLNKPYLYNNKQISTDDSGALIFTKDGSPVLSINDSPTHLSNKGVFLDKTTSRLAMKGKLLSSTGVIVLGEGFKASRPRMMTQIGSSDTYLTNELQLATMDGKPVMHSGKFVFKGDGDQLHNIYNENIVWNDKPVLQTEEGILSDRGLNEFKQLGILFSYESILFDNKSMLTKKINDTTRFGTSDIYVNKNNQLVDRYLNAITHRAYSVKNGINSELSTQLGALRNNIGERVSLLDTGRLKAVKGVVLTGTLKDGLRIPLDKYGHLITRNGKLDRLGESDVYVTNDRFLSSGKGLALQNNGKDTFQDINRFVTIDGIEAYGLKSYDGEIIRDLLNKDVYINALGQLVYADGLQITQTGLLAQDDGVLLAPDGLLLNRRKLEQLITDKDGNNVLYRNMDVYANADGQLIDSQGNFVLDEGGQAIYLKDGVLVNASGEVVDDAILFSGTRGISKGEVLMVTEPILGPNGKPLFINGIEAFSASDGSIVNSRGQPILGDDGEPLFLDVDGNITDSKGNVKNVKFENAQGTVIRDVSKGKPILRTLRGNKVLYKGKPVSMVDGYLVDNDGNKILDANGNPVQMNSNGQFVDEAGNVIKVDGLSVNGESFDLSDGLTTKSLLLDDNENPIRVNGRKVLLNDDGSLSYLDGSPVHDKFGNEVFKVGNEYTDALGNLIAFKPDDNSPFKDLKLVTGQDGSAIMYKGSKVFKRSDGSLIDEDGNPILDIDGKPLFMNDEDEIVGVDGELADLAMFRQGDNPAKNRGLLTSRINDSDLPSTLIGIEGITGLNGGPLMLNGKKVFKRADGTIIDEDGNAILGLGGKPLSMNENGDIVNSDGSKEDMSRFTINGKSAEGMQLIASSMPIRDLPTALRPSNIQSITGLNGEPLMLNGKKVFKRADGTIIDEDGNAILGLGGKPLSMNENGDIVNSDGSKEDMSRFTINGKSAEGMIVRSNPLSHIDVPQTIRADIKEAVFGGDGTPLLYKGKPVFKRADGSLVDEFGTAILDINGNPLYINKDNGIVDLKGNAVSTEGFSVNGKKVESGNLNKIESSDLPSIGDTGIRVTKDGLLIDKKGKMVTHNGRGVRRSKNGQLFYTDGSEVLDDKGNKVFMYDSGKLHDGQGNEVTGVTLLNGDNQLVGGADLEAKKIGTSDLFVNKRNNLVDASNKPFIHKGKPILVSNGKLITDDRKSVVDVKGNPISITRSGALIDRSRLPAKGAFISDIKGVVIDNKGRYVNSGGKMRALADGGPFVTESGLLVDKDGKALLINGKQVYLDDQNKLTSHNGRPIRYKGRKLHLDKRGNVLSENNEPLSFEGELVTLTNDGLTGSDGTRLANIDKKQISAKSQKKIETFLQPAQTVTESRPQVSSSFANNVTQVDATEKIGKEDENVEVTLTAAQILETNSRYQARKSALLSRINGMKTNFLAPINSSLVTPGGAEYASGINSQMNSAIQASIAPDGSLQSKPIIEKHKAGTMLYAVNTYKVNTDLNSKIVFNIFGVERGSKLYKGTAHGEVVLIYDYIVANFTKICPVDGECFQIEGVGIDPGTSEMAIDGSIDKHFWYRFGGLSLAALFQGGAESVQSSRERTEQTDETGKTVSYSGLDTDKLLISSTGVLAETLTGIFTENASRPYTGVIEKDEEIGIFLLEDMIVTE